MASSALDHDFPHSLTIDIPFPTHRLAKAALRSLSVDEELSSLVRRDFTLAQTSSDYSISESLMTPEKTSATSNDVQLTNSTSNLNITENGSILRTHYKATTPRMLRVAVNGFFESLGVIVQVMEELDVDVLHEKGLEGLEGVQGVEQGLTGSAVGVGG